MADVTGLAEHYGYGRLSVIHFDAHADTGDIQFGSLYGHGLPMRRVIESGAVRGRQVPPDRPAGLLAGAAGAGLDGRSRACAATRWPRSQRRGLDAVLDEAFAIATEDTDGVFLSVDIDVVDPGMAPGTGTPEPGGLTARELLDAVRRIGREMPTWSGMEIVEVAPPYDHADVTAMLGNRVVLETLVRHRPPARGRGRRHALGRDNPGAGRPAGRAGRLGGRPAADPAWWAPAASARRWSPPRPDVSSSKSFVVADYDLERARRAVELGRRRPVPPGPGGRQPGRRCGRTCSRTHRCDVLLNATDPRFVMPLFDAALEAGVHYLDMAMSLSSPHPTDPYTHPGVKLGDDQFAMDDALAGGGPDRAGRDGRRARACPTCSPGTPRITCSPRSTRSACATAATSRSRATTSRRRSPSGRPSRSA